MVQETVNKVEALDVLNRLRRDIVKATCLSWDVSTDYFEPLALEVANGDFIKVRMMAEADAEQVGAKTDIVSDILLHMAEVIDEAKAIFSASQGACDSKERGGSGEMLSEVFGNVIKTRAAFLEAREKLDTSRRWPEHYTNKSFDEASAEHRLALAEAMAELSSMLADLERHTV